MIGPKKQHVVQHNWLLEGPEPGNVKAGRREISNHCNKLGIKFDCHLNIAVYPWLTCCLFLGPRYLNGTFHTCQAMAVLKMLQWRR